jgi:hypothetical protein
MPTLRLKKLHYVALAICVALAAALAWAAATGAAGELLARTATYKEVTWLQLVPADWKPQERLDARKAALLQDGDALAKEMMRELREILDTAPTVAALDGDAVRMPGYVVALEQGKQGLTEFLLVPYYGACIHTPPPPANQIVHVVSRKPVKGFQTMSAVWVQGKLRTTRHTTSMGVSGYSMELARMEPYRPPAQ